MTPLVYGCVYNTKYVGMCLCVTVSLSLSGMVVDGVKTEDVFQAEAL